MSIALGFSMQASAQEERYFAVLFAADSEPKRAKFTHSFITFVKAEFDEQGERTDTPLSCHTISWLSPDREVKVWLPWSERGVNMDLETSLDTVLGNCAKVYAWGPFEISCEGYNRLVRQKARLDSGARRYKAVDLVWFRADNCVHAITGAWSGTGKLHFPLWKYGERSGDYLLKEMRKQGVILGEGHSWLLDELLPDDARTRGAIEPADEPPAAPVELPGDW